MHGELLRKLVKRKKLTQNQAADLLNISRTTLNKLFRMDTIDEVTREDIEKKFQVPPTYFPEPTIQPSPIVEADYPTHDIPNCWQQLVAAQQHIIQLQQQIIEMSKPGINAPKRTQQPV
jgi:transcriptional regulator with XRE-family HTH domain